jgi:tetratricopeptide (TPR) repeat protein
LLFQFKTRHALFLGEFSRLSGRILSKQSLEDIEKAIAIWKKHLEQIENKPFSSYTSKEIHEQFSDADLAEALKSIDRAIYGQEFSTQISNSLSILKNLSVTRFQIKREILRNA